MNLRRELFQAAHVRERIFGLENLTIIKDQEELTPVLHARTNLKSGTKTCECINNYDGTHFCHKSRFPPNKLTPDEFRSFDPSMYCQEPGRDSRTVPVHG